MELRDNYAVDAELFTAWRTGDQATLERKVSTWHAQVAARVGSGVEIRRVKVVSEPLSQYQRFTFDVSTAAADAGEQIRWLPRRLTSTIALPGNDFFVLDDQTALFNVLDGSDNRAEQQFFTDTDVVAMCRDAFEAAWTRAIPYREYQPPLAD